MKKNSPFSIYSLDRCSLDGYLSDGDTITPTLSISLPSLSLRHRTTDIQCSEPQHEGELHDVAVDKQELCSPTPLTSCNRLHRRIARCVVGGQKDILQAS